MTRPEKLSDIVAPAPLSDLPFWLCWKLVQFNDEVKVRKVPYYPSGERRHGTQGAPQDLAKLTTFAAARNAAIKGGFDGVGFAHTEGCGIVTLDFDKCVGPDGNVRQDVLDLVTMTYAEFSPSGKGIHAIFVGDADILGNHKANVDEGADFSVEAFSSSGFTTFTGNTLDHVDIVCGADHLEPLPDITIAACRKRFGPQKAKVDPDDFMAGREPSLNLTVGKMQDVLAELDPSMGREPWLRIGFALHHETEGDDTGFELWDEWSSNGDSYPGTEALRQQWDSFKGGTGKQLTTMRTAIWMAKEAGYSDNECDATTLDGEIAWLDPVPLPDALLAVPPLTKDMLPQELAPWLIDISERMSVSLDFVGIPAMVMMGALIGRKVVVRPEEFTDWSEPANVWGAIVAPPGAMKTPVVNQVLAPIKKFETAAQNENKAALEKHSLDVLFQKSARDAALANAKKNSVPTTAADFEQALMGCALEPPKPRLKRFVTTDATVEKLGEICADNPNGILYHRDELPTLFLELQREERAAVRGFLLTGWAGMEAYTFDRIGRGTTHIEAVNISLFGTAQPQRIMNLVSVSSAKHDDGMIQRLQLVAWPDFVDAWVPADRIPDVAARDAAFACCQRLSDLTAVAVEAENDEAGVTPFLRFSGEARDAFKVYRVELEAKVRSRSLPEPLAAHLAKYRGMVPRLALILHLAGGGSGQITGEAVRVAIKWAHYLEAHARRMYASVDVLISDTAGLILRRIRAGELNDGFSQRDITQKDWSGLRDAASVEKALTTLQDYGWLLLIKAPTRGRSKEIFRINPAALAIAMRG